MALMQKLGSALSLNNNSLHYKLLVNLWPTLQKSTHVDQMDSFANELVEKRTIKWEQTRDAVMQPKILTKQRVYKQMNYVAKSLSRDLDDLRKPDLCIDIRTLSQNQLDNIMEGILDDENQHDFDYVIRQCVLYEIIPSKEVLLRSMEYSAALPQIKTIEDLSEVCQIVNESFFKANCRFIPFKALALWRAGDIERALTKLSEGYQLQDLRNRKCLREAFRTMADETVGSKSEAVLIAITRTAEEIHRDFSEAFVIACVWKNTFTSQWFSDQQLSVDLFERHPELRDMVYRKATSLTHSFLSQHDVDAVHRLIQLFLKYDKKESCSMCLKMLFNYQYFHRDLRACSEIMQFCVDVDLTLSEIETQKLLNLLLNRPLLDLKSVSQTSSRKFQYRF